MPKIYEKFPAVLKCHHEDPLIRWDGGVGFNRIGMNSTRNIVNFFETLQNGGWGLKSTILFTYTMKSKHQLPVTATI